MAVHSICIYFTGAAHFAHKSCNCHEALCQCGFFFTKLTGRLANIVSCAHSFDRFQEVGFKGYLFNTLTALAFSLQFLCGNKDILCRLCQQHIPQSGISIGIKERIQVVSRKQILQDKQFFTENTGCLFHIISSRRNRIIATVDLHSFAHIITNANIVDNKAVVLAGEFSVNATNRLDQQMLLQRLIIVHVSQRRHIKAGDPHVDNNSDPEVRLLLFECSVQFFRTGAVLYTTQVVIHIRLIIAANAGNHCHKRHGFQPL